MTRATFSASSLAVSLLCASLPLTSYAQNLSYPELSVAPRASDRLQTEANAESQNRFFTHIPIQTSAAATLIAGVMSINDPGQPVEVEGASPSSYWAGITGVAVGGGWLALTGLMSVAYTPYKTGAAAIRAMPKGTTHEQLTRERAAEEQINAPARLGTRLTYLSVITNLGANAFIVASAAESTARVTGAIAIALSAAPLLFDYRWNEVADYQRDYKKRIYGPLSSITLAPRLTAQAANDGSLTVRHRLDGFIPTLNLSWPTNF